MVKKTSIPEYGYLALADISGYNKFVAGTEFEHAQEIVHDLLEFLVDRLRPILKLVQIEGDAVFAYTRESKIARGETLFELIENTYSEFKDRLSSIKRHQTCDCAACLNVNSLDLKFFVHFGEFLEHSVDDHHGLLGFAPMFVRKREWKASVVESAGWHGYALFTETALSKLEIQPEGFQAVEFAQNTIRTYGLNLQDRYQAQREARRVSIGPGEEHARLEAEIDAPRHAAWEWLNDPKKRNQWWVSFTRWSKGIRPGGRTGPGAINHCDHGLGDVAETVLDWRPFEYYTVEMRLSMGGLQILQTTWLDHKPDGKTSIRSYYRLRNPNLQWLGRPICGFLAWFISLELKRLNRILGDSNLGI